MEDQGLETLWPFSRAFKEFVADLHCFIHKDNLILDQYFSFD